MIGLILIMEASVDESQAIIGGAMMTSVQLNVNGRKRQIRQVLRNDDDEGFEAYYKGCHINIYEMAINGVYEKPRWGVDVAAETGCLIVDTWYYKDEKSIREILIEAVRNILL